MSVFYPKSMKNMVMPILGKYSQAIECVDFQAWQSPARSADFLRFGRGFFVFAPNGVPVVSIPFSFSARLLSAVSGDDRAWTMAMSINGIGFRSLRIGCHPQSFKFVA